MSDPPGRWALTPIRQRQRVYKFYGGMSLIYHAITDPATIKAAHARFKSVLQTNGNPVPNCKLGFRGGNDSTDICWHEDQKLWYGYQPTLSDCQ
jgi:hypothetical protein